MAYRDLQDRAAGELDALRLSREQRTAKRLDDLAAFIAGRWPELEGCPVAVMAAIRCRDQGLPASMIPAAREQLLGRAA